jgi:capsular exopolysaccharide synthesis family protein
MFFKRNKQVQKSNSTARHLITVQDPKAVVSEQFKTIRTNINFSMPDKDLKSLVITSSTPGEGKSTNSANIAVVFAQSGKRVLLVDCDMRKPTAHFTFGLKNVKGLSNLLTRQNSINEVVQDTMVQGLQIITSGLIPPNPAELLASQTMDRLIEELTAQFDLVIFDAPPVLSVTDAQIVANKVDGTILVVYAGKTEKENILKSKEVLMASKANILGVVLNHFKLEKEHFYYQYYGTEE